MYRKHKWEKLVPNTYADRRIELPQEKEVPQENNKDKMNWKETTHKNQ